MNKEKFVKKCMRNQKPKKKPKQKVVNIYVSDNKDFLAKCGRCKKYHLKSKLHHTQAGAEVCFRCMDELITTAQNKIVSDPEFKKKFDEMEEKCQQPTIANT